MNNKRVASIILRLIMIPFQIITKNNQRGWMVKKINRPALKFKTIS